MCDMQFEVAEMLMDLILFFLWAFISYIPAFQDSPFYDAYTYKESHRGKYIVDLETPL